MQPSRVILTQRQTYLEAQCADWAQWFQQNSPRVTLFYAAHRTDVRRARALFLETMMRGYLDILSESLATVRDLWQTREEPCMPMELKAKLDQDLHWYMIHKDGIIDPDKQWMFLLTMAGKLLVTCHQMVAELGKLQQATVLATIDGKDRVVVLAEDCLAQAGGVL